LSRLVLKVISILIMSFSTSRAAKFKALRLLNSDGKAAILYKSFPVRIVFHPPRHAVRSQQPTNV
jgi:hypothetical protein